MAAWRDYSAYLRSGQILANFRSLAPIWARWLNRTDRSAQALALHALVGFNLMLIMIIRIIMNSDFESSLASRVAAQVGHQQPVKTRLIGRQLGPRAASTRLNCLRIRLGCHSFQGWPIRLGLEGAPSHCGARRGRRAAFGASLAAAHKQAAGRKWPTGSRSERRAERARN